MRLRSHAAFNLIEVVLALVIIAVGVLAIVGLIPIGAQANQRAVANHYSADAADQMLSFIAAQLKKDATNWTTFLAQLPDNTVPDINAAPADLGGWTAVGTNFPNLYFWSPGGGINVYRLQQTNSAAVPVADFDGVMRLWKSPTTGWQYNATTTSWVSAIDTTYTRRVQLNLELSWPASLPFAARQKAYYALEVAKPN